MKRTLLATVAALAAFPAAAADPLYEQGVSARLGALFATADTSLRLDASNGALGTSLSLESDLGYEDTKTVPLFDATWRINPRHRIELGFARLARDSQRTITGEIQFGDSVFPVNSTVSSTFDSDIWRLTYGWSFYRDGGNELALLLGVHTTSFKTKLATSGGGIAEAADRTLPLPTLGLQGTWAVDPKWRLTGWVQVFSLDYNDYEGSLVNGAVSAEYRLSPNVALGAGYTVFDYDLDVTKGRARGSFDYQFSGPMIYVNAGF